MTTPRTTPMSDPHTAIAERLEEAALRFGRAPAHAYTLEAAPLLREAAQALRASADEVAKLRKAHRDADEQWGLASRAHQKAEAGHASARKALEEISRLIPGLGYEGVGTIAREALRASTIREEGEDMASCSKLAAAPQEVCPANASADLLAAVKMLDRYDSPTTDDADGSLLSLADRIEAMVYRDAVRTSGEPVAWRVKDFADGWILCSTLEAAEFQAKPVGALIEPLFAEPTREAAPSGWRK